MLQMNVAPHQSSAGLRRLGAAMFLFSDAVHPFCAAMFCLSAAYVNRMLRCLKRVSRAIVREEIPPMTECQVDIASEAAREEALDMSGKE